MCSSDLAKSDPIKTGVQATRLAIAAFIIPYMFVYNPAMLIIETNAFEVIQITISALMGMVGVGAALSNYYYTNTTLIERIILLAGGLGLIKPGIYSDLTGIAVLVGVFLLQKARLKKQNA